MWTAVRFFVGGCLLFAGLWQMEMLEVHRSYGFYNFVMPFGYEVPFWWARDVFYTFIVVAFILVLPYKKRGKHE